MHASNVRYMQAHSAVEAGERLAEGRAGGIKLIITLYPR